MATSFPPKFESFSERYTRSMNEFMETRNIIDHPQFESSVCMVPDDMVKEYPGLLQSHRDELRGRLQYKMKVLVKGNEYIIRTETMQIAKGKSTTTFSSFALLVFTNLLSMEVGEFGSYDNSCVGEYYEMYVLRKNAFTLKNVLNGVKPDAVDYETRVFRRMRFALDGLPADTEQINNLFIREK